MTIVEMCVHMCCNGCEMRVRKQLGKLEGIDSVEVDMARQKVTVTTTYVDQKKILKAVRKTGRRAVLWPYPNHPEDHNAVFGSHNYLNQNHPAAQTGQAGSTTAFMENPFANSTASTSSYNYRKHGTDDSIMAGYGYQMPVGGHSGGVVGERATCMFNDDNTSACSIM